MSSVFTVSMSLTGSTRADVNHVLIVERPTTWQMASVSRMAARNWFPGPRPSMRRAPSLPMSTNVTDAGTTGAPS